MLMESSWQDILKGNRSTSKFDISVVKYIMRDGNFRTPERITEEIYEEIAHSKKIGDSKSRKLQLETGRPTNTRFGLSRKTLHRFLNSSPLYESRHVGKNEMGIPVKEFRYIKGG